MKKRIVVLGAGYGGILTAKKLVRKLKHHDDVELTLIDKNSYHTMLTELHEVAAGRIPEDAIRIDLDKVFAGRKIDVVLDEIDTIDFEGKMLKGKVSDYPYDYLVVGTGSKPTFFGCEGAEKHALTLWSYEDAIRIKSHIWDAMGKASVELSPEKRKKYLTFVVIGCGFTGIEMVGELAEWMDQLCHTFHINRNEVRIISVDMMPIVLPMFDEKLRDKTVKRLKKMGVEVLLSHNIIAVKEDAVIIEGEGTIETYTSIWTAGVEGSVLMDTVELDKKPRGRVETDAHLRAKGYTDVFVVGDNIFYVPEGDLKPVPQMVENAEHSASLVAKNIIKTIDEEALESYEPTFHGAMVCIGGRYGVAQVGGSKKQFAFSGFIAMLIKHLVNCVYFIQLAGFNKVWTYLMHEIFHVNNRRSFVGGYFAKRSPNFWLVPLRMYIGWMWFKQGFDKLPRILEDPSNIFLIPKKAVDGVAASTSWAEEAAEVVAASTSWVEAGAEGVTEAVSAYGPALPVPGFIEAIVSWSMDMFFYNPDGTFTGLAAFVQGAMVVGEVIVGLMLIAGLFTAVGSVASIVMGLMIWSTGMASYDMLWYIFVSIGTIGGSGSTFGMDYYVLPFLKKHWKRIPFVKKWYLFTE